MQPNVENINAYLQARLRENSRREVAAVEAKPSFWTTRWRCGSSSFSR